MSFNRLTLLIFAPLLILVGILGFVIPPEQSLTSGAAPYNIFHLFFGIVALGILLARSETGAGYFNLGFGLIDLYQFVASYADLFPEQYFRWAAADDILHIVIGLILVLVGIYGLMTTRPVPVKYVSHSPFS
jgi:hypothetical protein